MPPTPSDTGSERFARVPKVSVGMPVYNQAPFLRKALDSLLSQTFGDFELIISDNASTDGTEAICREYATRDSRIRYLRQNENLGAIANFRFVLDEAQAEYFMWAASDDMWAADCLSQWVQVLDADETVSLVFSNYKVYWHASGKTEKYYVMPSIHDSVLHRLTIRMLTPVPSLIYGMFRRAIEIKIKPIDWFGVYFGFHMSTQGKIFICSDDLYTAGVKFERKTSASISGKRHRVLPFFFETKQLIRRTILWKYRPLLYLLLARQCILFYRHSRKQLKDEKVRSD